MKEDATQQKHKLRFSILGDSISTFSGYSEPAGAEFYDAEKKVLSRVTSQKDTWWGRTIEALGGTLLVNNSFSGSTVCGAVVQAHNPKAIKTDKRICFIKHL